MPHSPFSRSHALTAGPRVGLRFARAGDAAAVGALVGAARASDLLRFDPARRIVLCATAPVDGADRVMGVGGIDRRPGAEPDLIAVDEARTTGLDDLLAEALRSRAA